MLVKTFRFGDLQVPEDKVVTVTRPILGFERLKTFCLVEMEDIWPFLWLQSTQDQAIGFVVANPVVFFPDYRIVVNPREIADLQMSSVDTVETYVIVTLSERSEEVSANLQGPVLVNTEKRLARQLILVDSDYGITHSIMDAVNQLVPSDRRVARVPAGA